MIAKTADADSTIRLVHQLNPNALLVDANSLQDEVPTLLKRAKELNSKMTFVALTATITSMNRIRLFQEGADSVLDGRNLDQEFTEILGDIQVHPNNRS